MHRIRKLAALLLKKINESIRLELMLTFGICFAAALFFGMLVNGFIAHNSQSARIDYRPGVENIINMTKAAADDIQNRGISVKDKSTINDIIGKVDTEGGNIRTVIADLDGNVLYKSNNVEESRVDIYSLIKESVNLSENAYMDRREHSTIEENEEYVCFFPVSFTDSKAYLIVRGVPEGRVIYVNGDSPFVAALFGVMLFIVLFYIFTNNKMKYIEEIADGLIEISKGDLEYKVKKRGNDELASLAESINYMSSELHERIENERRVERSKNELITNVSHDLKTPLTSIKGYLGLIKDGRYKDYKELGDFVNIAYNKSEKLESLIKDLFEYTKLTNSGIRLDKKEISLNGLLEQLIDELIPLCEENNMTIKQEFAKEKLMVMADGAKMVRVFENLLVNAIRYGVKPGEILVKLYKAGGKAVVSIGNKCETLEKEDVDRLFERFYRVEKSRSQETGGSGLGLAIAKNIIELHGGEIKAEYKDNTIIFTVII